MTWKFALTFSASVISRNIEFHLKSPTVHPPPLTQSVGGSANNVATEKINGEPAAGLEGVSGATRT